MIEKDIEQRAIAKINSSGWMHYFPPHSWGRARAIFGVFYGMVQRPDGTTSFLKLTSIGHIADHEKEILAWAEKEKVKLSPGFAEVWAWDGKKSSFEIREVRN